MNVAYNSGNTARLSEKTKKLLKSHSRRHYIQPYFILSAIFILSSVVLTITLFLETQNYNSMAHEVIDSISQNKEKINEINNIMYNKNK